MHWYDIEQEIEEKDFVFFLRPPRDIHTWHLHLEKVIQKSPKYIITCENCKELLISYHNLSIIYKPNDYFNNQFYDDIIAKYSYLPKCIGITGSYGKSSTAYFCAQLIPKAYLISTLGCGEFGNLKKNIFTTPSFLSIRRQLYQYHPEWAIIEVSSHSLDQKRVKNIIFEASLFISIAVDHLDYHKTFDHYIQTKYLLKQQSKKFMIHQSISKYINDQTYPNNQYFIENNVFNINSKKYYFSEVQGWQRENLLSALILLDLAGLNIEEKKLYMPKGRMENIIDNIFVDGAHTSDQVYNIVSKLEGEWVFVYGASGKRLSKDLTGQDLEVGNFLYKYGISILTDDNPGFIDSEQILHKLAINDQYIIIQDRVEAIKTAIKKAIDLKIKVLILGKASESYNYIQYKDYTYFYNETNLIEMIYKNITQNKL